MKDLKPYVEYLINEKIKKEDAISMLKNESSLTGEEKNIIIAYCYPRQLLDRELPKRIQEYRSRRGIMSGFLTPDLGETTLLIESGKTEQYGRFIKHLMHSFSDPTKVFPIAGSGYETCPICGKTILYQDSWESYKPGEGEREKKEYLAYGSSESKIGICSDCLVQLLSAMNILENLDPGYLDWTKRYNPNSIKRAWDAFKLS